MANETVITVVGNLVDDPELRFAPSGVAVAKFRVASTPRVFNKTTNAWEDGDALFLTCSVWRQAAENVAESLTKGMRVIVQGRLKQRSYEDGQGVKRTVYELDVYEVGVSLARASAKVTKNPAGNGGQTQGDPWAGAKPAESNPVVRAADVGLTAGQRIPAASVPASPASGYSDEPPF